MAFSKSSVSKTKTATKFKVSFHSLRVIIKGIFEDEEIIHVEGEVDPVRDLEIIREELLLKDLEALEKNIAGLVKPAQRDKNLKAELVRCLSSFTIYLFLFIIHINILFFLHN